MRDVGSRDGRRTRQEIRRIARGGHECRDGRGERRNVGGQRRGARGERWHHGIEQAGRPRSVLRFQHERSRQPLHRDGIATVRVRCAGGRLAIGIDDSHGRAGKRRPDRDGATDGCCGLLGGLRTRRGRRAATATASACSK